MPLQEEDTIPVLPCMLYEKDGEQGDIDCLIKIEDHEIIVVTDVSMDALHASSLGS